MFPDLLNKKDDKNQILRQYFVLTLIFVIFSFPFLTNVINSLAYIFAGAGDIMV